MLADLDQGTGRSIRRIALRIEYDGRRFHGWQIQTGNRTVQQVLADAISDLVEHPVNLIGCSRTDTGVHALEHVSHFSTTATIPADRLPFALNCRLPEDLAVHEAAEVGPEFHARYGTVAKTYRYLIRQSRTPSPLLAGRAAFVHKPLDIPAMRAAAQSFIGEHDFSAFMDSGGEGKSTIRRIDRLTIDQSGSQIAIEVCGNGFLYHMVRILAGTLVYVGQGKIKPDEVPALIAAADRRLTGKTMPACGLYLVRVDYEPNVFLHSEYAVTERQTEGDAHV